MKVRRDSPTGDPFLGPERDFREMENLRRVRWLVLCGLCGVVWDLGCPDISSHLPTPDGGRWDGDPEWDPRPRKGPLMGTPKGTPKGEKSRVPSRDSPLHLLPTTEDLRRIPHGETRGNPERGHPTDTPQGLPSDSTSDR